MPVWRTDLEVYLPSRPSDLGNPPFRILLRSCRHGFSLAHHRFRVTDGPLLGSQEVPPAVQKKGPVLRRRGEALQPCRDNELVYPKTGCRSSK